MDQTKSQQLAEYLSVRLGILKLEARKEELSRLLSGNVGTALQSTPIKVGTVKRFGTNRIPKGVQLERVLNYFKVHELVSASDVIKDLGLKQPYNQFTNLERKGVIKKVAPGIFQLLNQEDSSNGQAVLAQSLEN